jgi:tetratricopeptide (TPR) repeat protein
VRKSLCGSAPRALTQTRRVRNPEKLRDRALRLMLMGRYRQAASAFRRSISLSGHRGFDRPFLAALLNDFGVLSKYAGRFARAKRLYERARKLIPRDDPRYNQFRATLYHNLGGLEHARGRHARALLYARDGIRLRRNLRDRDPCDLIADQVALAAILVELGRFREAQKIQHRLLRVCRRRFGVRHYETASLLSNLGALYVREGRFDAAERTLRSALRVLEGSLGRNHPRLVSVLSNLATLRARRGNLSEADTLYARALRLLERQFGPTYPSVATVRANRRKFHTLRNREARPQVRRRNRQKTGRQVQLPGLPPSCAGSR